MPNGKHKFSGYLEPSEVRAIINAIPAVSRHPDRDVLLIEFLWQTGARVGEIDIKPEHVGFDSIIMRNLKQIKKVKLKNGKNVRVHDPNATKVVQVSKDLCRLIKDFCRRNGIDKGEYIFQANRQRGKPLGDRYIRRMLEKASEEAMVFRAGKNNPRTGRRFKGAWPHILRHSSAMHLLEQVKDITIVKEQLDHADVKSTQIYSYAVEPRIKREIKDVDWTGVEPPPEKRKKAKKAV